jgi:hypothetical protein
MTANFWMSEGFWLLVLVLLFPAWSVFLIAGVALICRRWMEGEKSELDPAAASRPSGLRLEWLRDGFVSLLQFAVIAVVACSMAVIPSGALAPFDLMVPSSVLSGIGIGAIVLALVDANPLDRASHLEPRIRSASITLGASVFVAAQFIASQQDWSAVYLVIGIGVAVLALDGANPTNRDKDLGAYERMALSLIGASLVTAWKIRLMVH